MQQHTFKKKALSRFPWVRLFCSTPPGSYCYVITNPVLHTGLLKFDYSVVLEQRSCSILIAMYKMHGQLIIVSVTTATQSNLKNLGSPTETVTEPKRRIQANR